MKLWLAFLLLLPSCTLNREVTYKSLAIVYAREGQPVKAKDGSVLFLVPPIKPFAPEGEDALREQQIYQANQIEQKLGSRKHVRTAVWVNDEILWYIPPIRSTADKLVYLILWIDQTVINPIDRLRKFRIGGYHITVSGDLKNRRDPYILIQVV